MTVALTFAISACKTPTGVINVAVDEAFTDVSATIDARTPFIVPTNTPVPIPETTTESLTIVSHDGWQTDVDREEEERRLDEFGCYLDMMVKCDKKRFEQYECDLQTLIIRWGDEGYNILKCYDHIFEESAYEQMAQENNFVHIASGGLILAAGVRYLIAEDNDIIVIHNMDELVAYFRPIDSPQEALTYALLATGFEPRKFLSLPSPPDETESIQFFTDTLEDTHVVTTDDGYEVLLYESFSTCSKRATYAPVRVFIGTDGSVREGDVEIAYWYTCIGSD